MMPTNHLYRFDGSSSQDMLIDTDARIPATLGGGAVFDRGSVFVTASDKSVWSYASNVWKRRKSPSGATSNTANLALGATKQIVVEIIGFGAEK